MELLIENWGQPYDSNSEVHKANLIESRTDSDGALYIEGVFLQAEVVNRNKRLYPKKVLENAVAKYIKEQVRTKQALGEINHPARPNVDPSMAAIIIEDLWWDGNNVMGRARVIEGDNSHGDKLAANIRAGWIPGVSSRGLGTLQKTDKGYSIVNEGYTLTVGVDVVWGPSAPDAYVKSSRISESKDSNVITESSSGVDLLSAFKSIANI